MPDREKEMGEMGERGQRYKLPVISKLYGDVVYSVMTVVNKNCIAYLKAAKERDLKSSHNRKNSIIMRDHGC